MNWLKTQISKETWSPYVAGVFLGIVGLLAVILSNSLLGASGAFESLAGLIGKKIAPSLFTGVLRGPEAYLSCALRLPGQSSCW
jgi:hypothetical protein